MNKEQMLKRLAMNIVSQLFDLADVPVEKRQAVNDEADAFVLRLLQQCSVSGSLELLAQMLNERKELAKQGFETWQELQINSDSENALLRVMRLIGERQANDR